MLVVVEDGDVALLDQRALDLETLRRLDVFKVDATEGDRDALDGIDEGLRALGVDFDVEHVDTREALEQNALAFHYRLGSQRTEITQTENSGAIGDNRHQVALAGVAVSQLRIASDFAYRLGDARAIGQRKVTSGGGRLGELDAQLSRTGLGMVFERGSFQVSHVAFPLIFTGTDRRSSIRQERARSQANVRSRLSSPGPYDFSGRALTARSA